MKPSVSIIHSIPGRTRIRLHILNKSVGIIEAKLREIPDIYAVNYSPITNTAVLYHSYQVFNERLFKNTCTRLFECKQANKQGNPVHSEKGNNQKVKDLKLVFGAMIIEKTFMFSTPVGLFSLITPTALTTLYASRKIIFNGIKTIFKPREDTLTTTALIASVLKGSPSSALIIYIMSTVSDLLNEYTMKQTRGFVKDMLELDVKYAWLITENGSEVRVPVEEIKKDDHIMVFQGEKVPFDGKVTLHSADIDQSAITGEYLPVNVKKDAYIYAGSVVTEGKLAFQVDKVGNDLTVNRMIRLIEEAQGKQATIQTSSEKFTKRVVPVSFILSGIIYFVTKDWNRVLNMLVIDYVCGVQLSAATAISATIGKSAQKGVLIKGGQTLENLAKVDTIVLDKTGTITEGKPIVEEIHVFNGFTEEEVLAYAASVEEHSSHPIASAILSEAEQRGIEPLVHLDESVENYVGKGVLAEIDGEKVFAGSLLFMEEQGVTISSSQPEGIYIAKGEQLIGIIEIEDKIRAGMNILIKTLKSNGLRECIMLTGDNDLAASKIAKRLDIDRYIANAMPEDKAAFIKDLKENQNRVIMMVGDGINDAPALAYADIGVTLGGKKTDIAMETADIVIHSDNPLLISESIQSSKRAMRVIKQNIVATLVINTGAIVLGTFGVIKPVLGAAVHNAATIGVVLNGAKLILKGGE